MAKLNELRTKAKKILGFALSKKVENPIILDTTKVGIIWDFFIIVSVSSSAQMEAVVKTVDLEGKKNNIPVYHKEVDLNKWSFIDFYDIALNVFTEEARRFYNLESLWKNAKKVRFNNKLCCLKS